MGTYNKNSWEKKKLIVDLNSDCEITGKLKNSVRVENPVNCKVFDGYLTKRHNEKVK